jgi:hypothetical protein
MGERERERETVSLCVCVRVCACLSLCGHRRILRLPAWGMNRHASMRVLHLKDYTCRASAERACKAHEAREGCEPDACLTLESIDKETRNQVALRLARAHQYKVRNTHNSTVGTPPPTHTHTICRASH